MSQGDVCRRKAAVPHDPGWRPALNESAVVCGAVLVQQPRDVIASSDLGLFQPGLPSWPGVEYTSGGIFWDLFLSLFSFRATPKAHQGANSGSSGYRRTQKCLISSSFSDTYPSTPFLHPVCFTAAAYPVGTGSAAMRRTMPANSRRVSWLSASSRQ